MSSKLFEWTPDSKHCRTVPTSQMSLHSVCNVAETLALKGFADALGMKKSIHYWHVGMIHIAMIHYQ